jgi:DNA-binding CsgD family transcriptional regulator
MPTATAHYDRAELINRAQRAGSVREMFRAISGPMRRLVDFDAAIWLATDPATSLPVAPTRAENLGAFRGLSGLAGREACRRVWELEFGFEDINLYAELGRAQTPAAALRASTGDHPTRSARFREVLGPAGFGDELRVVFRVDGEPWAAVALMRAADAPPFDARETALLAGLSAPLAEAVRDHVRRAAADAAHFRRGPGLLLFDAAGELVCVNDHARDWLDELDPDAASDNAFGVRLPLVVMTTLMQARAIAEDRDDRHARVRMRSHATADWLVCHASTLRDANGQPGQTAVVIEPAPASEIAPLLSAAYGLTPRELDITGLVARGASTAAIAATLQLSAHTVRDYIKTIFEKVGVSSRGELVAKLFAEHAAPRHFAPGARDAVDAPH